MQANKIIALLEAGHAALAAIVAGAALPEALAPILTGVEAQFDGDMQACLLLLDEADRFGDVVGPSLPADYLQTLRAARTGERTSPFGWAAFSGAPVFSGEIAHDHAWTDGRKAALLHGWRACWAGPVFGARGHILGVLGMLFTAHRHPTQPETELLQVAARICAQAVERHVCERSISDSGDHFRHAIELNAQVLWTAAADGQLDYVAQRWTDWTGTSGQGGGWGDAIHPDDLGPTQRGWYQAVADGTPYGIEHRVRMRDGQYRWMRSRAYCRRKGDGDGAIVKWYGSTEDIHEHTMARAAQEKSEAEFRMLAKAMPNHAWAARADGMLYWFNERVYEYYGAAPGQMDGQAWVSMVHTDDVARVMAAWAEAVAGTLPYEIEYRARRAADGSYRWFLSRALPVRDADGGVLRWVGTNTDVQEQKNVADKLRYLNESLEIEVANRTADRDRMWRLSTDLMLVSDFSSMIIAINPAWLAVLGRHEQDTLGVDFLHLVHDEDRHATVQQLEKLEQGVTALHFENRYRHQDGSYRWISWTAVPADGLLHSIGRDVTDEKAARAALARSELALSQAQKLEAIGKLTGGVAHDFNNVLQIISGNLQLLQGAVGDVPTVGRRLETAAAAVDRGAKLSSQLLAFARRQPLKPLVTDMARLLSGMEPLLRRAIGDSIRAEFHVDAHLWHTLVDPQQLENVLLDIAINARDAMDSAGQLTLSLSNIDLDGADLVQDSDVPAGQYVLLAIADTGHGMDTATLAQIFEPFFTTKKDGEGTGLGLSMAYGFVKQSGGHIKVDSAPGAGSTFRLYLPRSSSSAAAVPPVLDGPALGGHETVLVVEDDLDVQATVVDMLRALGYTVLKANNAQAALTVIKSGVPVDLLFTDVVMPGPLRSPELARLARLQLPQLAVLFTSGYTQNAIGQGGRLDPGVELLSKPYRRDDLARKLRQLLAQQRPVPAPLPPMSAPLYAAPAPAPLAAAAKRTADAGRNILLVEDNADAREMTTELLLMLGHTVHAVASAEEALPMLGEQGLEVLLTDITLPLMSGVELAKLARLEQPHLSVIFSSGHDQRNTNVTDSAAVFLLKPFSIAQLQSALNA